MRRSRQIAAGMLTIAAGVTLAGYLNIGKTVYRDTSRLATPEESRTRTKDYLKEAKLSVDVIAQKHGAKIERYNLESYEGKAIPVLAFIVGDGYDRNTAVLIHGLTGTKETTVSVADKFLALGYNVLAYDQRSTGDSTANTTTFGVKEAEDTLSVLHHMDGQIGEDKKLVLWGTSFGGATAAIAASKADEGLIDYLILDSPLNSGVDMIREGVQKEVKGSRGWEKIVMSAGDVMWKLRQGFGFNAMNPAERLREAKETLPPVMIISSRDDDITPPYMTEQYLDALGSGATVHWTTGKHSRAFDLHSEQYQQWLKDFVTL